MVRCEVVADRDTCRCGRPLAEAELRRVFVRDRIDLLALCRCGEPTIVELVAGR